MHVVVRYVYSNWLVSSALQAGKVTSVTVASTFPRSFLLAQPSIGPKLKSLKVVSRAFLQNQVHVCKVEIGMAEQQRCQALQQGNLFAAAEQPHLSLTKLMQGLQLRPL